MPEPRILELDIETSPNIGYCWGLWDQNIALNQIIETQRVISFAAKWYEEPNKNTMFYSIYDQFEHRCTDESRRAMDLAAWDLLDEADIVVHYNGSQFDIPHLNREFWLMDLHGTTPPSPYKQVDLLQTVRKVAKFPSNKLAHITEALGLEGKLKNEGFELWVKCLAGDPTAWKTMRKYNRRDVTLLDDLYRLLLPWIVGHPNMGAFKGEHVCPACGSIDLVKRGYSYTAAGQYLRYRCSYCGKYSRDNKRTQHATLLNIV
jgi:DNA polymerase elongation subunit (family B)